MTRRQKHSLLILVAAVFLLLRFVHLDADYPRNLRWDDGISTDEGWYASSAVNQQTWGVSLLPGDMNIPVLMPVWSLIASVAFKTAGFSILTLRATSCLFFLVCVAELCCLLWRYGACDSIPLLLVMMSVNPWSFAFSRSGFLEFPMLSLVLLASLMCAGIAKDEPSRRTVSTRLLSAGAVFALAMLLKTTAVALMPVLLYVISVRADWVLRRVLRDAATLFTGVGLLYAPYWFMFVRPHMEDVHFYLSVVQNTLRWNPLGFLADASRPFRYGLGSDHLLFVGSLTLIALSLVVRRYRSLWSQPLYAFGAVWIISFLGFMVKHNNDPARYFAIVIPASVLIVSSCLRATPSVGARTILVLMLTLDLAINALQVSTAILHPTYSFRDASHAIGDIVREDPRHSTVLIGDEVHEVALQNGLRPVNLLFHADTISQQMQRYDPGWWVQFSPIDDGRCFRTVLSHAYTAERKGEWQIFYPGQHLVLWKLNRSADATLPEHLTRDQTAACAPPVYR